MRDETYHYPFYTKVEEKKSENSGQIQKVLV